MIWVLAPKISEDHTRLSDLEPLFVCQTCGQRGADIRPDWDWEPGGARVANRGWRYAAAYITALPKKEADTAEWQAAMQALMLVAELRGPTTFARIGVMRALNRHVERVFNPDRKDHHWGRRKLKRDE